MRDVDRRSFEATVWIVATLALVILTLPTLVVLITSFTASESLKFPPSGLSSRWYVELLDSDDLQAMTLRSFEVASAATASAAVLGTCAALALTRNRQRWARTLDAFFMSPLVVPWIAIGLGVLLLTSLAGLDLTSSGSTLALTGATLSTPQAAQSAQASVEAAIPAAMGALDGLKAQTDGLSTHAALVQSLGQAVTAPSLDDGGDGARLLALQIGQQLSAQPATPIANAAPQQVLALFRS